MAFLDLWKVYDSLNHYTLYGVITGVLKWFESYT